MSETGATNICVQCKGRIKEVDLYGHQFFRHKPRQDCLTWHHEDERHNWTHQAVPDHRRILGDTG